LINKIEISLQIARGFKFLSLVREFE